MSQTSIEIPFRQARNMIQACFPMAHSRRPVEVRFSDKVHVADYWSEGSRTEARFVHIHSNDGTYILATRQELDATENQKEANPLNLPIYDVNLGTTIALIEHSIFRGKSMGYRISFHPTRQEDWRSYLR